MKRLILCRHAKSSWKDLSLEDRDRPLNKRGKNNAPLMGQRLLQLGSVPQLVISSPAKRAYRTAVLVGREMGIDKKSIEVCTNLYDTSPASIIQFIHGLDAALSSVMLVGHNPEFTMLANWLGGLTIPNVPTCGMVALTFEGDSWQQVQGGKGSLLFFEYPKKNL